MVSLKPLYLPPLLGAVKQLEKFPGKASVIAYGENTHKKYQRIQVPGAKFPISYNYHLHRTQSDTLVIFCHGLLSSESTWVTPDFFSTDKWLPVRAKLSKDPTCLAISFGWCWMLYPKSATRTMYPQHLTVDTFMFILDKLMAEHGLTQKKVILIGSSMGGFNASMLMLGNPERFSKVLLHVPMICRIDQDPFNWFDFSFLSAPIIRGHFDKPAWAKYNPFVTLENNAKPLPPIQVHVSKADEFKLYEGGRGWAELLAGHGHKVELIENSGGHKDLSVDKAAEFIDN